MRLARRVLVLAAPLTIIAVPVVLAQTTAPIAGHQPVSGYVAARSYVWNGSTWQPAVPGGGGGDGVILDGSSAGQADVINSTPAGTEYGLVVRVIGGGGGTEYTEDAASAANPLGGQVMARRRDSLATETTTDGDVTALNSTGKGELYVKHADPIACTQSGTWASVGVTGTFFQATQPVSLATLPALVASSANIGDVDVLTLPALPAGTNNIGDVDVLTLPAVVISQTGTNNDVDVLTLPTATIQDGGNVISTDSADGAHVAIGATTDAAASGNGSVIGVLKQLRLLLAGGLPAALVGGRLDANIGAWLGSTAPTVGQKAMTSSLPVAIASDQSALPVTGTFWQATQPVSGTVTANAGTGTMDVNQIGRTTTVVSLQHTVATGTATCLASNAGLRKVKLQAAWANTVEVYVGGSTGVTTGTGKHLYPGQEDEFEIDNTSRLCLISASASQVVSAVAN